MPHPKQHAPTQPQLACARHTPPTADHLPKHTDLNAQSSAVSGDTRRTPRGEVTELAPAEVACPRCKEYGNPYDMSRVFCALCDGAGTVPTEAAVAYDLLKDTRIEHDLNVAYRIRREYIVCPE